MGAHQGQASKIVAPPPPADEAKAAEDTPMPAQTTAGPTRPILFIFVKDVLFWGSVAISGVGLFLLFRWLLG